MIAVIRLGVLLGCLVLSLGCDDANRPTAPSASPPPVVQAPPFNGFPAVPSLARVFVFSEPSTYQVRDYTTVSRFVLRQSELRQGGAFSLQYGSLGREYVGTYAEADGRITFTFAADARWDAVGTLNGDLLVVRYGLIMELSDFENAVYRRSQ
jgi:hypothetical protein